MSHQWTMEDFESIYARFKSSGLSVIDFCSNECIRPKRFYEWRSKLLRKIIQPEKQKGIHSEKSKQTIEADCRFSGEISDYLYTALKGWGIWVSNRLPGK